MIYRKALTQVARSCISESRYPLCETSASAQTHTSTQSKHKFPLFVWTVRPTLTVCSRKHVTRRCPFWRPRDNDCLVDISRLSFCPDVAVLGGGGSLFRSPLPWPWPLPPSPHLRVINRSCRRQRSTTRIDTLLHNGGGKMDASVTDVSVLSLVCQPLLSS